MITNARNKQISKRDSFIVEKAANFTPSEILVLMEREGFKPIGRSTIYDILERHGVKPKA